MGGEIIELRDSRRKHFFTVDNEIFDLNLSVYSLAVYFYLCRCAGDKSYAFPSLSNLQKALSISKDRLLKSLKELEGKNIIRREHRIGEKGNYQSTVYVLLDKSVWKKDSPSNGQGVVRQADKGRSSDEQRVVRETDKGCSSDGHKEKTNKKTHIEEKTEREISTPSLEEKEPSPKKEGKEKLEQAGGGEIFDAVKNQPATRKAIKSHSKYISPYAKRIVEVFKHHYMDKFACPPAIYPKAIENLERQLSFLSETEKAAFVEKALEVIPDYLNSDDYFIKHKVNYSFSGFVSQLPKLIHSSSSKKKEIGIKWKQVDTDPDIGGECYEL
ncbi:Helix-turn-helix domain-containing protein [Balnearium lithotrophicum]|uniref:Helix-turn-helix domain-containing protein n=1 Tax=Balnearium lithotrophicum TaxID=223788 RepID=A0A521CK44_9BACT|nr:helix-turn-helix domain-containing protein [Balnearium lithotrophicum]SMO59816.1 Helix-turn-helix domain-containing protein [Balnearium lithotrophicum]